MQFSKIFIAFVTFISIAVVCGAQCSCTKPNKCKNNQDPFTLGEVTTIHKIDYFNDHCFIYSENEKKWHVFGIVSPSVRFMHLVADSLTQTTWIEKESFVDGGAEIWAPHIVEKDGVYHMFYTKIGVPREIHHVTSTDLYTWTKSAGPILALKNDRSENLKNKDPMVFWDKKSKEWIMYYSIMKDERHWVVGYSTSTNLEEWSEFKICFDEHTESPGVESPFVVQRGRKYYLFLSARPWPVGGEDVFVSNNPYKWELKDQVKRIFPWHAAEIIQEKNGQWYMSLASGIEDDDLRIAPVNWNKGK
ncbi:hypothetical protein EYV94_13305 [Puteibacter caeruleilacunae]|nr:hypothetical protein EYV94_13305 [Puteibacter caeruleilacunae]